MRTKKERQDEVRTIISKLTELRLTVIYEPVQKLFDLMKVYVQEGSSVKINIDFPEIRKKIVGHLPIDKSEKCWVKLSSE